MHLHLDSYIELEYQCSCMYLDIMAKPSDTTVQAWARLLRAHQIALASVEKALKNDNLPPLIWYDVLLELERAGDKGLRPFELERELLLPQYGVSRLIERIEKAGHLKRETCEDDGRGQHLAITTAGRELRRRMWPVYGQAIEDAVGTKLTSTQARNISELLARLID